MLLERSGMDSKSHQHQGVNWCIDRELAPNKYGGVRGGIMADEMGLGKTIQMIGVMLCNFKHHTLIILPKSLISQWVNAIKSVLGHSPLLYHGSSVKKLTEADIMNAPIVISTYGMLRDMSPLLNIMWDRTIFDEAHHIRNSKTKKHISATKLKSKIMWFVTGTPIQNRESDLYSLFMMMKIPKKIYTIGKSKPNFEVINNIKRWLIIKRTKENTNLKLPKITNHNISVAWKCEDERSVAEEIHAHISSLNINIERANRFVSPWDHKILPFICFAKQVCTAPNSLGKHIKKLTGQEALCGNVMREETIGDNIIINSLENNSKLDSVIKLILSRKNNMCMKLVFTQFSVEMSIIQEHLVKSGVSVDIINGATSMSNREVILKNIANVERNYVLLLQIQVGCEGLNLQQFNEVYFLSPNWNPAVEDQAVARCHRIGQTNPVDIFRFHMEDFGRENINIENFIIETQTKKRNKMISSSDCYNANQISKRFIVIS
tara:strand:+ start:464 stop:1936 length:1473 start_codon:yes stop_codon:yes gene_type:complete